MSPMTKKHPHETTREVVATMVGKTIASAEFDDESDGFLRLTFTDGSTAVVCDYYREDGVRVVTVIPPEFGLEHS